MATKRRKKARKLLNHGLQVCGLSNLGFWKIRILGLEFVYGWEDRALQECKPSAWLPLYMEEQCFAPAGELISSPHVLWVTPPVTCCRSTWVSANKANIY